MRTATLNRISKLLILTVLVTFCFCFANIDKASADTTIGLEVVPTDDGGYTFNLTGDAEGANTKEKIMESVKKYTGDKNVIVLLMHDAAAKILTYETLPDVISYFRNKGYTFDNFYTIMQ